MFNFMSLISLLFFSFSSFAIMTTYENNKQNEESEFLMIPLEHPEIMMDSEDIISLRPLGPSRPEPVPYPHPYDPIHHPPTVELLDTPLEGDSGEEQWAYQSGQFVWVWNKGVRELVYIPPPVL